MLLTFPLGDFWRRASWDPTLGLVWSCPNWWLIILTPWSGDPKKLSGTYLKTLKCPFPPFKDSFRENIWRLFFFFKDVNLFISHFEGEACYYLQSVASFLLCQDNMVWIDRLGKDTRFFLVSFSVIPPPRAKSFQTV